jgi:hypothetical protein
MASGGSVAETVDKFWSSCQYNLDTAYALLDNVLQYLPCSGEIKDAVDLELEVDEKFALDFQTVGFRDQYFVFHRNPVLPGRILILILLVLSFVSIILFVLATPRARLDWTR